MGLPAASPPVVIPRSAVCDEESASVLCAGSHDCRACPAARKLGCGYCSRRIESPHRPGRAPRARLVHARGRSPGLGRAAFARRSFRDAGALHLQSQRTLRRSRQSAPQSAQDSAGAIELFLATFHKVEPAALSGSLYRRHDREAVRHLFRVAAGLDSDDARRSRDLGTGPRGLSHRPRPHSRDYIARFPFSEQLNRPRNINDPHPAPSRFTHCHYNCLCNIVSCDSSIFDTCETRRTISQSSQLRSPAESERPIRPANFVRLYSRIQASMMCLPQYQSLSAT